MLLPRIPPELTRGPFTLAQAKAAGVSRAMLAGPTWRRVIRGVYVMAELPDTRQVRAQAVGLVVEPDVFLCGISAAWMHGVDVHRALEAVPSLWVGCLNGRRTRDRAGWTVREISVCPDRLTTVAGICVTDPVRTGFDCARWCRLAEAVVIIDGLAHATSCQIDAIRAYAATQHHIRNLRRVPGVLDLCDARAESPPESRLRLLCVMDGLCPEPQLEVWHEGLFVARLDLAFAAQKVAVEYDGAWHADRVSADERRRATLEALGWIVIKVYAEDMRTDIGRREVLARIRSALARRS